jgi:hypothetical protein
MTVLLVLAACAFLNRLAGDSWGFIPMSRLPGRPLWYCSALIASVAYLAGASPLFGLAFLAWRFAEWGRWIDLHKNDGNRDGKKPTSLERIIGKLPGSDRDAVALTYRHAIGVPALYWLVGPAAMAFPLLSTAAYLIANHFQPRSNHIPLAELFGGLVWGGYILLG